MLKRIKTYLARPEAGAGLLFAALALVIAKRWLTAWLSRGSAGFTDAIAAGQDALFPAWTLVSFLVGAWLAFVLLRRRPGPRGLRRALLVAAVHAVGAIRFYDWGLMLLSVMPLFALLPALLLPSERRAD